MQLTNKQVDKFWENMVVLKYFILMFMIAIFTACSSTPKSVVIYDTKPHLVFNREVMKGDTLVKIERWKAVKNGIEQDSIINEQIIGALVLFHNMHLEHENI